MQQYSVVRMDIYKKMMGNLCQEMFDEMLLLALFGVLLSSYVGYVSENAAWKLQHIHQKHVIKKNHSLVRWKINMGVSARY